jgi:hypothetical protein
VSVKPYSHSFGYFAKKIEDDRQLYLQVSSWTALRSLRPEFFTVCKAISTGVDITFFGVIIPNIFLRRAEYRLLPSGAFKRGMVGF